MNETGKEEEEAGGSGGGAGESDDEDERQNLFAPGNDSDREFLILAKHALVLFEKGLFQLGVSSDWPGREFLAVAALKTMCIEAIWGCHV
ncbi:predicted protein [Histoplasma mississippiense (nom. inval.)]|uniref:predicted protein n=1 Tax=Ajellomyces capsulatus (strain NAm1 / WU24) TaxID=2059318 RepID=UPI000157B7DD|nr:predicted protein [Histoplasma mississippiense (nom. inval.)]EDN03701.1 predicted protein [Histoplasma mississippiense (nom. inval.)]